MRLQTTSYNERRYGKPWIAKVTFDDAGKSNFEFGAWIGQDGFTGILELSVNVGDIVAFGQKDNRQPRNSAPDFFIVEQVVAEVDDKWDTPALRSVSKSDAYLHATTAPDTDSLRTEKAALLVRLAEIDAVLNA